MIAAVAVGDLAQLVWVSLVATIGLSIAGAVCVLGVTRAGELRRDGHAAAASAFAALGLVGGLAIAAGVIFALTVIVNT